MNDVVDTPATLPYGPRATPHRVSRHTATLLVGVTFLAVFLAVGWRNWGDSIRAYFAEAAAARRFVWTFDAAAHALTPDRGVWLAPSTGRPGDRSAEKHLDALLADYPGAPADERRMKPGIVLFVRRYDEGGRSWLTFASASGAGLEVYTFGRENRKLGRYDLLLETPTLARSPGVSIALETIEVRGDAAVRTGLMIGGVRHDVTWTPGQAPAASAGGSAPVATVTPHDGWVTGTEWELARPGWRFANGPAPDAEWPQQPGEGAAPRPVPQAAAFTPHGDLAVVDYRRIALVDPDSGHVQVHALPRGLQTVGISDFEFSPGGTRLFIGADKTAKYLVDTLTGRARWFADARESARAVFADERTLLTAVGWEQAYFDWESLRKQPFSMPRLDSDPLPPSESLPLSFYEFDAAGDRIVLRSFRTVHVLERGTRKMVREFAESDVGSDLSLSPDGATLAGSSDGGLRLTDVRTGALLWSDMNRRIGRVAWSADGRRLAAAGGRWAYVWSLDEPRSVARFPLAGAGAGRDHSDIAVALSIDGYKLAAVGPSALAYWRDVDATARGDGEQARNPGAPVTSRPQGGPQRP